MNKFSYSAYGLNLTSTLSLPELVSGEGKVDVCIEIDRRKSLAHREYSPILCTDASPNRIHLTWGAVGDLLIEEGCRITVIPAPNADENDLRLFVLGSGLGVLLHQRGLLVLHASGVAIHDRIVGFTGAKGRGKSTMAASLHRCGYPLISDELLVVRFDAKGRPLAIPGSPQMRLWSDALVGIGGHPDSAVRVRSGIDKFSVSATKIATEVLPFYSLYLLDIGEELSVQLTSPSEAFFGVMQHLYVYRFGTKFLQSTGATRAFQQLSWLLKKIIVKRLLRQWNLSQLADIAKLVEQDACRGLAPAQ